MQCVCQIDTLSNKQNDHTLNVFHRSYFQQYALAFYFMLWFLFASYFVFTHTHTHTHTLSPDKLWVFSFYPFLKVSVVDFVSIAEPISIDCPYTRSFSSKCNNIESVGAGRGGGGAFANSHMVNLYAFVAALTICHQYDWSSYLASISSNRATIGAASACVCVCLSRIRFQ